MVMLPLSGRSWNSTKTAHPGEWDRHVEFDVVVGAFFVFICCMYALHFYLKRKEREKFDLNYLPSEMTEAHTSYEQ